MAAKKCFLIGLLCLIVLSGCAAQPDGNWKVSSPEAQGMDSAKLEAALQVDQTYPQNAIHSLLILRNGVIVAEKYYQTYEQDSQNTLYSCTKSFISALVGIAIEEGHIKGVDQPVADFFPEAMQVNPDPRKDAMRLEDLLTMRAGLAWEEGNPAYGSLVSSSDWVAYMLNLPMVAEPGSAFNYCSGCTHVLSGVLRQATGLPTQEYAKARLFDPLGITNYSWETDAAGNAVGGWGLALSARDMAKFGYLFLQNGVWNGKQLVPKSWVAQSTGHGQPTEGKWTYAYQWWVSPDEQVYAAQGMHGQKIYVVPAKQLVVVVTAGFDDDSSIGQLVLDAAINAVK
jgi:CubicO group peptidase (beta-lactamase class C family)